MKTIINLLLLASLFLSCNKSSKMNKIPNTAIVRVSIGYYPPEKEKEVEEKLQTIFKDQIMPAVKKLEGNINYFVAMDKEKNSLSNVSIWTSKETALQMDGMKEMKEMGKIFMAMGVKFEAITNHEMLWQLPEMN